MIVEQETIDFLLLLTSFLEDGLEKDPEET